MVDKKIIDTSKRLPCNDNPCNSCPYRKDTPPGVWDSSEYEKLKLWDEPFASGGIFLCHHSTTAGKDSVCRGWLEVHQENLSVRMVTMAQVTFNGIPTKVPLYNSGTEACEAGIKGVKRPSQEACVVIDKLVKARKNKWKKTRKSKQTRNSMNNSEKPSKPGSK